MRLMEPLIPSMTLYRGVEIRRLYDCYIDAFGVKHKTLQAAHDSLDKSWESHDDPDDWIDVMYEVTP